MSVQDSQSYSNSENTGWSSSTGGSSSSGSSGIQDTGVRAQQKTGELIDQAQEKVGDVASKVKEQASTQVSNQKDRAAEGLDNVADAIRQTGDQLRQNDKAAPVAQYADQLAMGVETVSNYLKSRSISDIFREVESFARREPALFLGGALTLGLLGGRFLRSSGSSSSSNQYQGNTSLARPMDTYGYGTYGTYGSRSTGYSTGLASDVAPGYSAYDLSGSTSGRSGSTGSVTSSGNYADATGSYTDSSTGLSDLDLSSGSTSTTGTGYSSGGSSSTTGTGYTSGGSSSTGSGYSSGSSSSTTGNDYSSGSSNYGTGSSYGSGGTRRRGTGSEGPLGGA